MSATANSLVELSEPRARGLRTFNLVVGLVHLAQAGAMMALANDFTLPVTRNFMSGPPGPTPATEEWFRIELAPFVALFLLLAAIDHIAMALPGINAKYNAMLRGKRNDFRWLEYSVSASLMIVMIAMICGVADFAALLAIAGANSAMIFFGLLMERYNKATGTGVDWLPYLYGCIIGIVPWLGIVSVIWASEANSTDGGVPAFVYGIVVSIFLLFNTFSVNQLLQYKGVGKWRDYIFGEKAYIVFSLIAKSLLAWQVYANILIPAEETKAPSTSLLDAAHAIAGMIGLG